MSFQQERRVWYVPWISCGYAFVVVTDVFGRLKSYRVSEILSTNGTAGPLLYGKRRPIYHPPTEPLVLCCMENADLFTRRLPRMVIVTSNGRGGISIISSAVEGILSYAVRRIKDASESDDEEQENRSAKKERKNMVNGNNSDGAILQLLEMGGGKWNRDTVARSLLAADSDPENAVDHLVSNYQVMVVTPDYDRLGQIRIHGGASRHNNIDMAPIREAPILMKVEIIGLVDVFLETMVRTWF